MKNIDIQIKKIPENQSERKSSLRFLLIYFGKLIQSNWLYGLAKKKKLPSLWSRVKNLVKDFIKQQTWKIKWFKNENYFVAISHFFTSLSIFG